MSTTALARTILLAFLLAMLAMPAAFADNVSLQNANWNFSSATGTLDLSGWDIAGCPAAGLPATGCTGLGTIVFTDTQASASSFFTFFADLELSTPFFNETGAIQGTTSPGESWEIGDPCGGASPCKIYDDVTNNTLDNANHLGGAGDVATGLGFNYALVAGQTATITLTFAEAAPAAAPGIVLVMNHPQDANNATATAVYEYASLDIQPPTTTVPEPGALSLLAGPLGLLWVAGKRWRNRQSRCAVGR